MLEEIDELTYLGCLFQTSLRHPDCDSARTNREGVFRLMRKALDLVQHVVSDGTCQSNGDMSPTVNGDSGIGLATSQPTASRCIKDFEVSLLLFFMHVCDSHLKNLEFLKLYRTVPDFRQSMLSFFQ